MKSGLIGGVNIAETKISVKNAEDVIIEIVIVVVYFATP